MKTLYFDCAMGAAGDMLTAALLELVPDKDRVIEKINAALGGRAELSYADDRKCGIRGTHVTVKIHGEEESEEMHHSHHSHHTSAQEIYAAIEAMELPEKVKEDARSVYAMIAQAESNVHGVPVESVHFHELGSVDALADVLSVCMLMDEIRPERVYASPVNTGSGTVKSAHGILPVPTPATEQILRGVPVYAGAVRAELCTPTGAALLKHFADEFGPMPLMCVERTGYGTGKKEFEAANVVRAMLGETEESAERLIELRCNVDDMTGEEISFAQRELFDNGALDVYTISIGMKKSRPGIMLTCMCREKDRERLIRCLFKHTRTLGIREYACARHRLERNITCKQSSFGPILIKTAEGWGVKREKIEHDVLAAVARANGLTLREAEKKIREEFAAQECGERPETER